MTSLHDMRIAVLVDDLFGQAELASPKRALRGVGATVSIITLKGPSVIGLHHATKGDTFKVNLTLDQVKADDFDGLMLPGEIFNAGALCVVPVAQAFVRAFERTQRPIAMIRHGPWLMVSTDLVRSRTLTSWPTLQGDIHNADGIWVDREMMTDRDWVSSCEPDNLPTFNRTFIELLAQHAHV